MPSCLTKPLSHMNRTLILVALLCTGLSSFAQKRKNVQPELPPISLPEAMAQYRFSDAEVILTQQIADLRKRNVDVTAKEEQLRAVLRAKNRMQATERVCFVDSVVCNKTDMLKHIHLSGECGKVDTYANHFGKKDGGGSTVYLSQFADKVIFAKKDAKGHLRLYASLLTGNEWSQPEPLGEAGLGDHGDVEQNYPFMMNDGTTLYYAAKGEESMGGYDIFMTRYDADENRFLAPENIGMPFNSPANDFLYCVDEFNHIGYFVTDRRMPQDKVCVYTFIPNQTRRIYNMQELGEERMAAQARLHSIAQTWENKEAVQQARRRVESIRHDGTGKEIQQDAFTLVIDDELTLTSLHDVYNAELRKKVTFWLECQKEQEKAEQNLEALRLRYVGAKGEERKKLAERILSEEKKVRELDVTVKQQVKEIRKAYHTK